MRQAASIFAVMYVAMSGLFLHADEASTRPLPATRTSASAKKMPIPSDWKPIEYSGHFRFWVPRKWNQRNMVFTLPALTSEGVLPKFQMQSNACGVSLEVAAEKQRKSDLSDLPGFKITRYEPTQRGGREAWLITGDLTVPIPVTAGVPAQSPIVARFYQVVVTDCKEQHSFMFSGDSRAFSRNFPVVKRVFDSFEWLSVPQATQP